MLDGLVQRNGNGRFGKKGHADAALRIRLLYMVEEGKKR